MANSMTERRRIVCQACDLPYYAARETCPYCASAGVSEPDAQGTDTTGGREESAGDVRAGSSSGLFARLKSALGL